jgi:O-acetyl-ADP-ribose deacetylase
MSDVVNFDRVGGDDEQLLARLKKLLERATGLTGAITKGAHNAVSGVPLWPGANVRFSKPDVITVERAAMWLEGGKVCLSMWPGELKDQYRHVYSDSNSVERLIALTSNPGWELSANFHLAYPHAPAVYRWYPRRHLSGAEYVIQWLDDCRAGMAGGRTHQQIKDPQFWEWLIERRYADVSDRMAFDAWLEKQPPRRQIHIRPSVQILYTWTTSEATTLDHSGQLVREVGHSIKRALTALGESAQVGV